MRTINPVCLYVNNLRGSLLQKLSCFYQKWLNCGNELPPCLNFFWSEQMSYRSRLLFKSETVEPPGSLLLRGFLGSQLLLSSPSGFSMGGDSGDLNGSQEFQPNSWATMSAKARYPISLSCIFVSQFHVIGSCVRCTLTWCLFYFIWARSSSASTGQASYCCCILAGSRCSPLPWWTRGSPYWLLGLSFDCSHFDDHQPCF